MIVRAGETPAVKGGFPRCWQSDQDDALHCGRP
jgi:hypothetical protein